MLQTQNEIGIQCGAQASRLLVGKRGPSWGVFDKLDFVRENILAWPSAGVAPKTLCSSSADACCRSQSRIAFSRYPP